MITYPRVFTRQSYSTSTSSFFPISKRLRKQKEKAKVPQIVKRSVKQISDSLSIVETTLRTFVPHPLTDTLSFVETIDYDSILTYTLSDTLSISEETLYSFIYSLSLIDTLSIQEEINRSSLLDISFSTLGNTFPVIDAQSLEIFPYNYIDPPSYGSINYALMVDSRFNYSSTCLFKLLIPFTDPQRLEAQSYFDYWKTNPLTIQIENDLWQGYLTQNNQQILMRQFSPGPHLVQVEFEAVRIK